jgi:hypothetical protein
MELPATVIHHPLQMESDEESLPNPLLPPASPLQNEEEKEIDISSKGRSRSLALVRGVAFLHEKIRVHKQDTNLVLEPLIANEYGK